MTTFGKFILYLLVVLQVLGELFDNRVHLMIFVHLMLGLLGLVLKLACQRGILDHSELGGSN